MSSEDFRKRLSIRDTNDGIRQELQSQYEYLTSKESQKYMQYVLCILGREIEREFPGVEFLLKGRTKSRISYDRKIEKVLRKDSNKDKKIFDTLGCCIVIKHIPFGANIEHKLCQKHLIERAEKNTEIEETRLELKKIIEEYEELEVAEEDELREAELELIELEGKANESDEAKIKKQRLEKMKIRVSEEKEAHKNHIASIKKLIETYQQQYDMEDKNANNALARHILNRLIDRPIIAEKLGITRVPNRSKVHDGGKSGYYIAYHDCVTSSKAKDWIKKIQDRTVQNSEEMEENKGHHVTSSKEEAWILEIQAMSIQNYEQTKENGEAQHSKCDGKARVLPPLGNTAEANEKFVKIVSEEKPRHMVYQSSTKNPDGTMSKSRVYACSDVEDVTYHFLEALEKNPNLFKQVIGREDLFSDKGEIVTEDDIDKIDI